ncbi:MAG: histidine kinase dimerization/phospho-acceptor domain-containing protein, partial [Gemmataceae bacterium]
MPSDHHDPYLELAELAGGFIHELKNHINTLSLNLQLLAEDLDPPETPRERRGFDRVKSLTDECRRLVELSNDFLRFARALTLLRAARVGGVVSAAVRGSRSAGRLLSDRLGLLA